MSRITWYLPTSFNTLRPRQNRRHFADAIFKCIFLNENAWISLKISLKFVPRVRINNIPTLVQIMAWRRPGDKPFSESMMVSLPTHICVTRPQWVKAINTWGFFCIGSTYSPYGLLSKDDLLCHNICCIRCQGLMCLVVYNDCNMPQVKHIHRSLWVGDWQLSLQWGVGVT